MAKDATTKVTSLASDWNMRACMDGETWYDIHKVILFSTVPATVPATFHIAVAAIHEALGELWT
jgi:hypothetical protein